MLRTIVVSSGKGGVGKTTITAKLGREIANMGYRVVIMDTDFGLNNLDVLMDIESKIVYDIIDVVHNRCRLKQALVQDTIAPSLFVLPACHTYENSQINSQNIKAVINSMTNLFDFCLIDSPAGIEEGFYRAICSANEALIVTTPHVSAIRDADKVLQIVKGYRLASVNVIVNRARGDLIVGSEMVAGEDISKILHTPIIGIIPEDDSYNLMSNLGLITDRESDAEEAINLTARNICFGTTILFDVTKKYKGFFGRIKRSMRKRI